MNFLNHATSKAENGSTIAREKAKKLDKIVNYHKSKGSFQDVSFILNIMKKHPNYTDNLNDNSRVSLENIKRACEEWISNDNWSFDVFYNIEHHYDDFYTVKPKELCLAILYPQLPITDLRGITYEIKDLVVFVPMYIDTETGFIEMSSNIRGKRLSYSTAELYSRYCHSHLNTSNIFSYFNYNFCLGSTDDNPFCSALIAANGNYNNYEYVLNAILNLENYLKHEASDSNPHAKFRNINEVPLTRGVHSLYTQWDSGSITYINKNYSLLANWEHLLSMIVSSGTVQEFNDNLEVYMVNHFLAFNVENTEKLEEYIKNLFKSQIQREIEEENFSFDTMETYTALDLLYQKVSQNQFMYFSLNTQEAFSFPNWVREQESKIATFNGNYYYQLNGNKIEFKILDLEDKIAQNENNESEDTSKQQKLDFLALIDTCRINPQFLTKVFEVLTNYSNTKTLKEINQKLIYAD